MFEKLKDIEKETISKLAICNDLDSLEMIKVYYLGRKGVLTSLLRNINTLTPEDRPKFGQVSNELKLKLQNYVDNKFKEIAASLKKAEIEKETIDISLPGKPLNLGKFHPIVTTLEEVKDVFIKLGFEVADGPEIETEYYNFDALNFPADHPAKDMQDTIYIADKTLLRTHTSPVQIRTFLKEKPPVKIIAPGRVYRHDSDISHSPMFHQVEGFLVDEDVNFGDLKWILNHFAKELFGENVSLRFRPSFFPFTEPSAEIDISCFLCGAKGCRVCSNTGWIEVLGAGMIDPNVMKEVNYDSDKYTGFAFGLGIERIAMLKYGINDIRLFFENDVRFLDQF